MIYLENSEVAKIMAGTDFTIVLSSITNREGDNEDPNTAQFKFEFYDAIVASKILNSNYTAESKDVYEISYDGVTRLNNYVDEHGRLCFVFNSLTNIVNSNVYYSQYENKADGVFDDKKDDVVTAGKLPIGIYKRITTCPSTMFDGSLTIFKGEIRATYSPYIDETTGTWFQYNDATKQFVDTKVPAYLKFEDLTQEQIAELQKPAIDAAKLADAATASANTAANTANTAADKAVTASEKADTSTGLANAAAANATSAANSANSAKEAIEANETTRQQNEVIRQQNEQSRTSAFNEIVADANEVIPAADTAAQTATNAANAANTATANAIAATSKANTATDAANTATANAIAATTSADTAKDAANTAAGNANTAKDAANTAAGNANAAAGAANTAAGNATEAAGAANTAAGNATEAASAAQKVVDEADLSTILRKTAQVLTPEEQDIVLSNIDAQKRLQAGENVIIEDNVISAKGLKVVQTLGDSEVDVMSQKATTNFLSKFRIPLNKDGYYTSLGKFQPDSNYKSSDFFDVIPKQNYSYGSFTRICFFSENNSFILEISGGSGNLTVPENAYFCALSVSNAQLPNLIFYNTENIFGELPYGGLYGINKRIDNNELSLLNLYRPKYQSINGYYILPNGGLQASSTYSYIDYMEVVQGVYTTQNVHRLAMYDKNHIFVAYTEENGDLAIEENVRYVRFSFSTSRIDDVLFYKKEKPLLQISDEAIYENIICKLETQQQLDACKISLNSGEIGQVGAIYKIPILNNSGYRLNFKFKFPRNINNGTDITELFRLQPIGSSAGINGGCIIRTINSDISSDSSSSQLLCNAQIDCRGSNSINNYRRSYSPNEQTSRMPFFGETAFSVRFAGDVTLIENQDIKLSIDDQGLRIFHSTTNNNIHVEQFPEDKNLGTFVNSIYDKCKVGGSLHGIVEFNYFRGYPNSTDDLIRFSNISLVVNYGGEKSWQAFPTFCKLVDEKWHSVEVIYNPNDNTYKGFQFIFDGQFVLPFDLRSATTAPSNEYLVATLGAEGVIIKDFTFERNETESTYPEIAIYYLHEVIDGEYNYAGGSSTSVEGISRMIDYNKNRGATFVRYEDIRRFLNGEIQLPKKCFTVIHDDLYFLADESINVINRVKNLYTMHGIKATFCIMFENETIQPEQKEAINKDKSFFDFCIHARSHAYPSTSYNYDELVSEIRLARQLFRDNIELTNKWIYTFGNYDRNMKEILKSEGFGISCTTQSNEFVNATFDIMSLPRQIADDGSDLVIKNTD